jgi:hypothetical protein
MATAPDPPPTQRIEEFLTCCICLKILDEQEHCLAFIRFVKHVLRGMRPKFTSRKPERNVEPQPVQCPTCRTKFQFRQGESVEGLPSNYILPTIYMLDILKIQQQAQKLPCESCHAQLPVACRRIELNVTWLCGNCL